MEDFVRKVIEGDGSEPPKACQDAFSNKFSNAINVDWYDRGECWEAVFYKNKLEHVASFTTEGELSEYKLMLQEPYLPGRISEVLKKKGEIMNAVLRNKGNSLEYEVIVMDSDMKRSMFVFSEQGKVLLSRDL